MYIRELYVAFCTFLVEAKGIGFGKREVVYARKYTGE